MSEVNTGGSAFPWIEEDLDALKWSHRGMTLRDYFAAKVEIPDDMGWNAAALMGEKPPQWSAEGDFENSMKCAKWWAEAEAKYRYLRADAMLAAREVKQ